MTSEEIIRFAHDPRTHQMAMLEDDRFVVLDLTTRADSELVGVPMRELPSQGALIGAIVRDGEAIFPHGNDWLAGRRPRDRLHRGGAGGDGRARPVSTERRAAPRLGVDVSAALHLVGSLVKYLGPSALVPAGFAVAHSEPVWPFLAAGALVSGFGLALERVTTGAEEVGVREGYLVIAVTWIIIAAYGAAPYVLAGDPQLGRPVDAMFEGMSGFTTTGASVATDVPALPVSIQVWRQLTVWLGGDRGGHDRARGAAQAAHRRPAAAGVRERRPGRGERAVEPDPGHGPAFRDALRRR